MNPRHRKHYNPSVLINAHRRHHYSHNPMGGGLVGPIQHTIKHPGQVLTSGALGAVAAYMTIAVPNWLLPFPGADIMSKVIRFATRLAAGGLVTWAGHRFARGSSGAIAAGASIAAVGSFAFDFLGTRVIIGAGDTGQTPFALLAGVTGTGTVAGVGAYARLRSYSPAMLPAARGHMHTNLGAPPAFPARTLVGHRLFQVITIVLAVMVGEVAIMARRIFHHHRGLWFTREAMVASRRLHGLTTGADRLFATRLPVFHGGTRSPLW